MNGALALRKGEADVRATRTQTKRRRRPKRARKPAAEDRASTPAAASNVTPIRRQAVQSINPITASDGSAALALTAERNPSAEPFLSHCLVARPGDGVQAEKLQTAYVDWCRANGFKPISSAKLSQGLTALGLRKTRAGTNGWAVYHDVVLRCAWTHGTDVPFAQDIVI